MSGGITAAGVAAAASVVSAIYTISGAGKSKPQAAAAAPAPVVTEPKALPTRADAGREAERASLAEQMRRRGRASTILTDTQESDTLGV